MEVPYREPLVVEGFEFGNAKGAPACSIVGSTRGDEVQQAYIAANLVRRLVELEERGAIANGARILVIPCANPFSMNVASRFWPADGTDVNRLFPGDTAGSPTERLAAALFDAVRSSTYGIQLASFNQPGDFLPHVRVMQASELSADALALAGDFRLPCVVARTPDAFDHGTLNHTWQEFGTRAFSLYSQTTDRIDRRSAAVVEAAVLRFLAAHGLVRGRSDGGTESLRLAEADLADVRTTKAGYLEGRVRPGDVVEKGQELGLVLDALDAHVRETLTAPAAGRAFFCRTKALVQQPMIAYRLVPLG